MSSNTKIQKMLKNIYEKRIYWLLTFHRLNQNHHYNARAAKNYQLDSPSTETTRYGIYCFAKKEAEAFNEIQRMNIPDLPNCEFTDFRKEILLLCYSKYCS